jgi:uncharacterized membrane protein YoaK (UPF0700 family)
MKVRMGPADTRSTPLSVRHAAFAAALLAFTAGFVDTCGFIALFGLFTAHVTGNFVLIGAVAAGQGHGLLAKLLALPVFIAVVALAHFAAGRGGPGSARTLLLTQAALLALCIAFGTIAAPIQSPDVPLAVLTGMTAVAAMAVQNAASRGVFANLAPTTVMTGNVTQLTIDLVDLFTGVITDRAATVVRIRKTWPAVVVFTAGSAAGAFAFTAVGFSGLAVPIIAVLTLVVQLRASTH